MGDLIHTLPAVTDAIKALPEIQFDWVAEKGFAEIPQWHPAVAQCIPIEIRRWRKNIFNLGTYKEIVAFVKKIKSYEYDYVIDAQGLIKSAFVSRLANGKHCGMDAKSCKEPLAARFYQNKISISKQLHAIERVRALFALVLQYEYQTSGLDYGLLASNFTNKNYPEPYIVFLHGSSGENKLWPVEKWRALTDIAIANGNAVYLPWGNEIERQRAEMIAAGKQLCYVLPKMNLTEIAGLLANATGVVGVDTGLAHLTAALSIPAVTLYIDTFPKLTGACGNNQVCMSKNEKQEQIIETAGLKSVFNEHLLAEEVWKQLAKNLV